LYGFLVLRHSRREILWLGVAAHPSAQWIEAYGWQQAPQYIVRDRDCVSGDAFIRRVRAMGIRDRPIAPRSPWQNGHAERFIGSIRRDCLDHVVVFGERHLCHLLGSYQKYYIAANGLGAEVLPAGKAASSRRQPGAALARRALQGLFASDREMV
jgi:transposase InsO family protein